MYRVLSGLSALLFLAGCASGPDGDRERPPSGFDSAARLADRGQYAEALPILRCVAMQGEGFEIAQYLAGHSALALSRAETTPSLLREDMRVEGFDRLIAAGEAGWPAAQAELAETFAAINTDEATRNAAYWAAVYRANVRERAYGLDRLDNDVEARLANRIGEAGLADAAERAAGFTITPLERSAPTPECAPYLRRGPGAGRGEQARQRPNGGRRGDGEGGPGGGGRGGRPGGG